MIKTLSAEDAEALSAVHAKAFDRSWSADSIRSLVEPSNVVVFGDQPLTGFVIVRIAAQEAEVLTLAVTPACRRQGLGRRLLERAEEAAVRLGAATLFLEVAENNPAARGLYHSLGFTPAGRRRGYYRGPPGSAVDALVLRKTPLAPA